MYLPPTCRANGELAKSSGISVDAGSARVDLPSLVPVDEGSGCAMHREGRRSSLITISLSSADSSLVATGPTLPWALYLRWAQPELTIFNNRHVIFIYLVTGNNGIRYPSPWTDSVCYRWRLTGLEYQGSLDTVRSCPLQTPSCHAGTRSEPVPSTVG